MQKLLNFFSKNCNDKLTNEIVNFEKLGPGE